MHTHSTAATALSLVVDELPCVHHQQQLLLGGSLPVVPFEVFGSAELARRVCSAMEGKQAVILANHGTVACGANLDLAFENALLLEWACERLSSVLGTPRGLNADQGRAISEAAAARNYGSTQIAGL